MTTIRWQPDRKPSPPPWPVPPLGTAFSRGLACRCPACGQTHLFNGFLRVVPECRACGAPLGLARADDAPPYFTILITGHIVVPLLVIMQKYDNPPSWELAAIFLPMTLFIALALMRPVKGAVVAAMLHFGMLKEPVVEFPSSPQLAGFRTKGWSPTNQDPAGL